jgi:hypothetical protein
LVLPGQDAPMNIISWLIARIMQFFLGRGLERRNHQSTNDGESFAHEIETATRKGNFDADYRAATDILRLRMSARYPDNFHARVGSEINSVRDYGDERAGAIDTASAAIAAALRKGATVKQAADAGAASVGI